MKKNTCTLRGSLLRAAMSIALVAGLIPAQAMSNFAFAAEASEAPVAEEAQVESEVSQEDAQDGSSGEQAIQSDTPSEDQASTASDSDAGATADKDAAEQPAQQIVNGTITNAADVEIMSASVQLGTQSAALISYNGLVYQTNTSDPATVSLVGWTGKAPQGTLAVPERIAQGSATYIVTGIRLNGAGTAEATQPSDGVAENGEGEDSGESAEGDSDDESDLDNPYTTEFFAEDQKASTVTAVTIPAAVESIDPGFFQLFPNATSVSVANDNHTYKSYNGMLFGKNDAGDPTDLLLVPEGMEGAAVLPNSLASVPACVLTRCTKLQAIDFPEGSTANALFSTWNGILYNSDKTVLIAAPAGLGASATIAAECIEISEGAFFGNASLRTIVAEGNVEAIADSFEQSVVESATVITNDREPWEAAGFKNFADPIQPGTEYTEEGKGSGVTFTLLDDYTLAVSWQSEAPEKVEIPSQAEIEGQTFTVSTIASEGFANQANLKEVVIPSSVTRILEGAFQNSGLTSANIPGSVVAIGANAFANCAALTDVTLNEGTTTIGESAFSGTAIEKVVLPASINTIGDNAFASNTNLDTVLALGEIDSVSTSALSETHGVNIYVPMSEDEDYAFTAGAPAQGNHLMSYGIKASEEPIELEVGESVDLFEGGHLETPGDIQASSSYKSNVSVTDNCTVTAKQLGATPVTTTLSLGDTQLASTTQTVKVSIEPSNGITNDSFKSVDNSSKVNEESISEDNQIHSDIVERESAADSFTESKSVTKMDIAPEEFVPSIIDPADIIEESDLSGNNTGGQDKTDNEQATTSLDITGATANVIGKIKKAIADINAPMLLSVNNDVATQSNYVTITLDLNPLPNDLVQHGCDVDALHYYPLSSTWKVVRNGYEGNPYYYSGSLYLASSDNGSIPTSQLGLKFMGFTTDPFGGGSRYIDSNAKIDPNWSPTNNMTLYAEYNGDDQTRIYFDYQDGTGLIGDDICTYGIVPDGHSIPLRSGYIFKGFFTEKTGGVQYFELDPTDEEYAQPVRRWDLPSGTTLYAQWITAASQYGGVSDLGQLSFYDTKLKKSIFSLDDDGRCDWIEVHWEGTPNVNDLQSWEMVTLTIAGYGYGYGGNESHGFITSSGVVFDCVEFKTTMKVPRCDFSSISFNATTKEFNATIEGTIIPKEYSVTLNTNGGTVNSGNVTSFQTGSNTTLPTDVTRPGYRFDGWYQNKNFYGSRAYIIDGSDSDDKTYHAKWTVIKYTVTLDPKDGVLSGYGSKDSNGCYKFQYDIEFGDEDTNSFNAPIPTHPNSSNQFIGWRGSWVDSEGASDPWTKDGRVHKEWYATYETTGNYRLTAVWRTDITLNNVKPNGVTSVTDNSNVYYYSSTGATVSNNQTTDLGGGYSLVALDDSGLNNKLSNSFAKADNDVILTALPSVTPDGYTFNGYVKTGSTDNRITDSGGIHRYAILYPPCGANAASETVWDAQWIPKRFNASYPSGGKLTRTEFDFNTELTLDLSGGEIIDKVIGPDWANNKRRVPAGSFALPDVARSGYVFTGWTLSGTAFTANWSKTEVLKVGDTFIRNNLKYKVLTVNDSTKTATVSVERAYRPSYAGETGISEPSGVLDFTKTVSEKGYVCTITALQYNTEYESGALQGCQNVTQVILGNQITEITSSAFESCKGLTSITIPSSVKRIEPYAFQYCSNLASVRIEGNLEEIGVSAFEHCEKLQDVVFPDSIGKISNNAFAACPIHNLTLHTVGTIGSLAFGNNNDALGYHYLTGDVTIDKVDYIQAGAFSHSQIDCFCVKGNVESIDFDAFDHSTLYKFVIDGSIKTISSGAFHDVTSINEILFGGNVGQIGSKAFAGNPVQILQFRGDVDEIGDQAFEKYDTNANSRGLDLYFGGNVGTIGNRAFIDNDLSEYGGLFFNGSVRSIGASAFEDVRIPKLEFGGAVGNIDPYAFNDCGIESVVFNNGNTPLTIGSCAFKGNNFTTVALPSKTTSIGNHAFWQCKRLVTVSSLGSITSLPESVFESCSSLQNVTLPNGLTSIGHNAFRKCSSLRSITLPDSVTDVGLYAFASNSTTSVGGVSIYVNSSIASGRVQNLTGYVEGGPTSPCTTVYANRPGVKVEAWAEAGYSIATRTISFNMNGHGKQVAAKSIWYNYRPIDNKPTMIKPTDPTDDNYIFRGWYENAPSATFGWDSTDNYITSDKTLNANWEEKRTSCTVTWHPNGGFFEGMQPDDTRADTVLAGSQISIDGSIITIPPVMIPTNPSNRFVGWSTSKSASSPITWPQTINDDVTFYAVWVNQFTVAFDPNGGNWNGSTDPIVTKYDKNSVVSKPDNPVMNNKIFIGWAESPDSEALIVTPISTATKSVNYYAQWRSDTADVTVVHLLQEPDGSYSEAYSDFIEAEVGVIFNAPLKDYPGYRINPNHPHYKASGLVTSDEILELSIYYDFIPYKVTYEYIGSIPYGENAPTDSQGYCYGQSVNLKYPKNIAGWEFNGWKMKSGNAVFLVDSLEMGTSDVVLQGTWTAHPSKFEFKANGGIPAPLPKEGATDQEVSNRSMPIVQKAGSIFKGWFDNEAFEGNAVEQLPERFPAGGKIYYAKWEEEIYPITWHLNGGSWEDGTSGNKITYVKYGEPTNEIGAKVVPPENKKFVGWGISNASETAVPFPVINSSGEPTHTEYWAIYGDDTVDYIVECFEVDGGSIKDAQTYSGRPGETITLKAPTIVGFTISGEGEKSITLRVGNLNVIRFDYTRNSNTVVFDGHGGKGGMAGQTKVGYFKHGQQLPAELTDTAKPNKTGYEFAGWYTTASGDDGVQYYNSNGERTYNDIWTAEHPNAELQLHARWTAQAYSIKFEAGEGKGDGYIIDFTYDGGEQTTFGEPKEGISAPDEDGKFAGWKLTFGDETKIYQPSDAANKFAGVNGKTLTAVAQWAKSTFTVTWTAGQGGTFADGNTEISTQSPAGSMVADCKPATAPTKIGAIFDGWSLNGKPVTDEELVNMKVEGNLTFAANWDQPSFLVTFKGGADDAKYKGIYQGNLPSFASAQEAESHRGEANYRFYNEGIGAVQQWVQYGATEQTLPNIVDLYKLAGASPTSKNWTRTNAAEGEPIWTGDMALGGPSGGKGDEHFVSLYNNGSPAVLYAEFTPSLVVDMPSTAKITVEQTNSELKITSGAASFTSMSAADLEVTGLREVYDSADPDVQKDQKDQYMSNAKKLLGLDSLMNVSITVCKDDPNAKAAWGFNLYDRSSKPAVGDAIIVPSGAACSVLFGIEGLSHSATSIKSTDKLDIAKLGYTVEIAQ